MTKRILMTTISCLVLTSAGLTASPLAIAQEPNSNQATVQDKYRETTLRSYYADLAAAERAAQEGDYDRALTSYRDFLGAQQQQASPYWIGAQCEPVAEVTIRIDVPQYKDLDKIVHKGGLRVNAVTAGSPAEAAGIAEGDYILKFSDSATNAIADLTAAIEQVKTSQTKAFICREGNARWVDITPAKRPDQSKQQSEGQTSQSWQPPNLVWQRYWMDHMQRDPGSAAAATYWLGAVQAYNQIPEDVEIVTRKKGQGPTSITVRRGDKEWVVNKLDEITQLPTDIQAYVSGLLTSQNQMAQWRRSNQANPYWNGIVYGSTTQPTEDLSLQRRIAEISKQLEELKKSVDAIKK